MLTTTYWYYRIRKITITIITTIVLCILIQRIRNWPELVFYYRGPTIINRSPCFIFKYKEAKVNSSLERESKEPARIITACDQDK